MANNQLAPDARNSKYQWKYPWGLLCLYFLNLIFLMFTMIGMAGSVTYLFFTTPIPAKSDLYVVNGNFQSANSAHGYKGASHFHLHLLQDGHSINLCQQDYDDLHQMISNLNIGDNIEVLVRKVHDKNNCEDIWEITRDGQPVVSYDQMKALKNAANHRLIKIGYISTPLTAIGIAVAYLLFRPLKRAKEKNLQLQSKSYGD